MTKKFVKEIISGWGGYPRKTANVFYPNKIEQILSEIKNGEIIARGNGRAYGDSAISEKNTINMKNFNNILSFDEDNGTLIVESGVLLEDIIKTFLPKGWFPYVTPGSKYVTVGGMIAADVHGKNHHKDGSFGNFIEWIDLINNEGKINRCSKEENPELFNWTIGGMGLTGIIIKASFKLRLIETCWVKQRIITSNNIDQTLDIFKKTMNSTYSVAWLDCSKKGKGIGQSLIMLGEHALVNDIKIKDKIDPLKLIKEKKIKIPFYLPRLVFK
jgi:FAD/FMN-containing dehydrogenases